jgi:RND family efflux transporter MFP subunit
MEGARPEDIRTLEATLAAARARLVENSATLRRYENLYENDNVSKAEYDQRRAAQQVAEAEVRSSEERLQIGRTGARAEDMEAMEARIRAMEAQLTQARDALEDTVLRAPYDGIVTETYVENFEFVQAREEILSLQDVSAVEIVAQIPESLVVRGKMEQLPTFLARFDSLPGRDFPARATEITAEADPVTGTYAVTFQTEQPEEGNILAGMAAEILLEQPAQFESFFTVPVAAIFADEQDLSYVWTLDSSTMTPRRVQVGVGEMVGDSVVVTEGLVVGDEIITAGTHFVREGQPVRRITDELRERR